MQDPTVTNWRTTNLAFVDLELSGLNPHVHEILEIGLILVVRQPELGVIEEWESKVKPEHIETADPDSLKVNGYNGEEWKDALSLDEALNVFLPKVGGAILVGQNVAWDWWFLKEALLQRNMPTPFVRQLLDIHSIAYAKLKDSPLAEFHLGQIGEFLGILQAERHRALADARRAFEVYKKLLST
ncbi:3'-5' exonuclease [Candidatus Azambacteria bacterium]|nr:3'-5' exonuclease [Candidatus Azambacteria bacterium]